MTRKSRVAAVAAVASIVLTLALAILFMSGFVGSYNAENAGFWVGDYGLELVGPEGVGLFHCGDAVGPVPGANC